MNQIPYEWIKGNLNEPMPRNAVPICKDKDGSNVYFGQCKIENQLLAVKIVPNRKQAYVAYKGCEKAVTNFNVLVNNLKVPQIWKKCNKIDNSILENAVECGHDNNNNKVYVGKTYHGPYCVPGYINAATKKIHIPFGHKEHKYSVFEILLINKEFIARETKEKDIDITKTNSEDDITNTNSQNDITNTTKNDITNTTSSEDDLTNINSQNDITNTNSENDITNTNSQNDIANTTSENDITNTTNSEDDLTNINSQNDITNTNSEDDITNTNSQNDIANTTSENDITNTNSENDITNTTSEDGCSYLISMPRDQNVWVKSTKSVGD